MVHRRIHTRHLPPEPIPAVPAAQIRPLPHPRRRPRGRRRRRQPPHQAGRRVPSLYPPAPRVQVLALGYQGHCHRLRLLLVLRLRYPCLLACLGGLLDYPLCLDDATTNPAYDQVPICAFLLRKDQIRSVINNDLSEMAVRGCYVIPRPFYL